MPDYRFEWTGDDPRWTYLKVTDADEPEWSGWSLDPSDGDTPENLERDADLFIAAAAWLREEERRTPGTEAHVAWVESERAAGRAHAARLAASSAPRPYLLGAKQLAPGWEIRKGILANWG